MQLETRVEDSLAQLARGGWRGWRVRPGSRAREFGAKPFGKRVADMYERNRAAFGVEARAKRAGEKRHHPRACARQGCAGRTGGARPSAGAAKKKNARCARAVLGEARRRGYLGDAVHRPVAEGRRRARACGFGTRARSGPEAAVNGPKIVGPIVDLLVAPPARPSPGRRSYKRRAAAICSRAGAGPRALGAGRARGAVRARVPEAHDAIKRAIGREEAARWSWPSTAGGEIRRRRRRRRRWRLTSPPTISKKTAIRRYRENEGRERTRPRDVRGAAASVVTASPPKRSEGERRGARRATRATSRR